MALIFLPISLVAALSGFTDISAAPADIFYIFLVLLILAEHIQGLAAPNPDRWACKGSG